MSRLLFWLALVILVVMAIRSKLRAKGMMPPGAARRQGPSPQSQQPQQNQAAESMTCCAHCGVYFPSSEAIRADGLDYCSPAHVRLPPK